MCFKNIKRCLKFLKHRVLQRMVLLETSIYNYSKFLYRVLLTDISLKLELEGQINIKIVITLPGVLFNKKNIHKHFIK